MSESTTNANGDTPIEYQLSAAEAAISQEHKASPPPDGGYGWVCLFAYFCVTAFTWGVVAVRSV